MPVARGRRGDADLAPALRALLSPSRTPPPAGHAEAPHEARSAAHGPRTGKQRGTPSNGSAYHTTATCGHLLARYSNAIVTDHRPRRPASTPAPRGARRARWGATTGATTAMARGAAHEQPGATGTVSGVPWRTIRAGVADGVAPVVAPEEVAVAPVPRCVSRAYTHGKQHRSPISHQEEKKPRDKDLVITRGKRPYTLSIRKRHRRRQLPESYLGTWPPPASPPPNFRVFPRVAVGSQAHFISRTPLRLFGPFTPQCPPDSAPEGISFSPSP